MTDLARARHSKSLAPAWLVFKKLSFSYFKGGGGGGRGRGSFLLTQNVAAEGEKKRAEKKRKTTLACSFDQLYTLGIASESKEKSLKKYKTLVDSVFKIPG